MSSQRDAQHPSDWAVNGNTDGRYWDHTTGESINCVHTARGDYSPWWEVNLKRPYPVYRITVWARNDSLSTVSQLDNSVITVDGEECYRFPADTTGWPTKIDINCTRVISGTVIRVTKLSDARNDSDYTLSLCELQVWSCSDGYWGSGCDQVCGQCRDGVSCDKVTGQCDSGCKVPGMEPPLCTKACPPSTQGEDCADTCGACDNHTCDPQTGYCQRCAANYSMPLCTDCIDGHWGDNCQLKCGHCDMGGPCKKHSGQCWGLCTAGSWGKACDKTCPGHCGGDGACDRDSGHCLHFCQPGWLDNPQCLTPCDAGHYGFKCTKACGHCKDGKPCSPDTGFCEDGCDEGFEGHLCQKARYFMNYSTMKEETEEQDPKGLANPRNVAIMTTVIGAGLLIAIALLALRWYRKTRSVIKKEPILNLEPFTSEETEMWKCGESTTGLSTHAWAGTFLSLNSGSEVHENVCNELYDKFKWPGGASALYRATP